MYFYHIDFYYFQLISRSFLFCSWRKAKKCLNLAVSEECMPIDNLIIDQMERVIRKMTLRIAKEFWEPPLVPSESSKHYILKKYFVKDIENVPTHFR